MQSLAKLIKGLFKRAKSPSNLGSVKTFQERYDELGVFSYHEHGFSIAYEGFSKTLLWGEITQLNVYKRDLLTIDRIDMEIVYDDKAFIISEDLPGWHQFIKKTKSIFSSIPSEWECEIIQPAFAPNWRNIYTKQ